MAYTRRGWLAVVRLAGLGMLTPSLAGKAGASAFARLWATETGAAPCPFRLAVINDEITQDFEKACQIASGDFGLSWIELRSMWNKNVTEINPKQIEDAQKILEEHKLRVTDIASPLFKTDWPGAPRSSKSESRDQFRADFNAKLQRAAERCAKVNLILLLENEMSCNTATGEESAAVLKAIPDSNFMLNWDPGNAE